MKNLIVLIMAVITMVGCGTTTKLQTLTPSQESEPLWPVYHGPRATIAVQEFTCRNRKSQFIGSDISEMVATALLQSGRFYLMAPQSEQKADITVQGDIIDFLFFADETPASVLEQFAAAAGKEGINLAKEKAYISGTLKLVDTKTGSVIGTARVQGIPSQWHRKAVLTPAGSLIGFKDTAMGKAMSAFVKNAVTAVIQLVPQSYYKEP